MTVICLLTAVPVSAAARKGPDVNRVTTWNKITDYFATVGKGEREKLNILRRRKALRKARRQEKARLAAEKEVQQRASQYRSSYISQ